MNADRADELLDEILNEGTVVVLVENTYQCGRESKSVHRVTAPPTEAEPDTEPFDNWFGLVCHGLTGDGHPCGSREHAYYEATIIEAPGRPELVGVDYSWEG